MGWSGNLTASSAQGSEITFTPDTTIAHGYTVDVFAAPKKAVYRFILKGSGGTVTAISESGASYSAGGTGGNTVGYLLLEKGQTVYIGAGGTCSAAFVSKATGSALKDISKDDLYFVAGAGGGGGARWGEQYNMKSGSGGAGGGTSGAAGSGGQAGGTQSSGYAYGVGGTGGYGNDGASYHRGDGGDGYYGGYSGAFSSGTAHGGGGGAGYVYGASLTVGSNTYTSSTAQGGGAGSNSTGSVSVTYYADAELPVTFDGVKLLEIIFNGTKVEHLVYNGAAVFMHRIKRSTRTFEEGMMALLREPKALKEAFV